MYFVLFNGPPRSGKDTAALAVMRHFQDSRPVLWEKFSFPNKFGFAGMMAAGIDDFGNVEIFEDCKEEIVPPLGVSYRQWQIDFSEKYMKPLYGHDVFGRLLLDRCSPYFAKHNTLCCISDCGFQVECDVLANYYKADQCLLINIHRDGCSFKGDSRSYVTPTGAMAHRYLHNDYSKEAFEATAKEIVMEWLHEKERNA